MYDFTDCTPSFNNIVVTEEAGLVDLRTDVSNKEQFMKWRTALSEKHNYCFNVSREYKCPSLPYSARFHCIFGDKRHKGKIKTNTSCDVTMRVKIKSKTIDTMKKDKLVKTHPCFITIMGTHNHSTESAAALGQLRVQESTAEEFNQYFDLGMTPSQARQHHQEKMDFDLSYRDNNGRNPVRRSVYYLHEKWMQTHYGGKSMCETIKSYAEIYPNASIVLEESAGRFNAVLVTAYMHRIHKEFPEACEVVFVDSTSYVDKINTCVTPLLCAGPAGACPLGIIFTSSQDEAGYVAGFKLLKSVLGSDGFFKQGYPHCFITDNNDAEQNALKKVWPQSELFLSTFHLLQQTWRYLCEASHGINKNDRQKLMKVMQNLVYVTSEEEFEVTWEMFLKSSEATEYAQFKCYLQKLVERKFDWCIAYRAGKLVRSHNINNFAESTMYIIKDAILNRCKDYDTCQLIAYMNEIFDSYMKHRLLEAALGRSKPKSIAEINIIESDVEKVGDFQFAVKSQSQSGNTIYNVDMRTGICDCSVGQTGAVCKHQVACAEVSFLKLPQTFCSTPSNRLWLAGIALGQNMVPSVDTRPAIDDRQDNKDKAAFLDIFSTTLDRLRDGETSKALSVMGERLKGIKSSRQLNDCLYSFGSSLVKLSGAGRGKIRCRPTSTARRGIDSTRGAAAVGKGQKRKASLLPKTAKKPRNLSSNVKENLPNGMPSIKAEVEFVNVGDCEPPENTFVYL